MQPVTALQVTTLVGRVFECSFSQRLCAVLGSSTQTINLEVRTWPVSVAQVHGTCQEKLERAALRATRFLCPGAEGGPTCAVRQGVRRLAERC